jgi:YhcH/YjgK/YiaL family protein
MRKFIINSILTMGILSIFGCQTAKDPTLWSDKKTEKWFLKGEWLNGLNAVPDPSINHKSLAIAYFKNPEKWNIAFAFLRSGDLTKLAPGRHDIDGENIYAMMNEYTTKDPDSALFEAHRKYIDIQFMVSGNELIGLAPLSSKTDVTQPYSDEGDAELFHVKESKSLKASPGRFFIFFPDDAHSPGIRDGAAMPVRKVVVKVKVD